MSVGHSNEQIVGAPAFKMLRSISRKRESIVYTASPNVGETRIDGDSLRTAQTCQSPVLEVCLTKGLCPNEMHAMLSCDSFVFLMSLLYVRVLGVLGVHRLLWMQLAME